MSLGEKFRHFKCEEVKNCRFEPTQQHLNLYFILDILFYDDGIFMSLSVSRDKILTCVVGDHSY
jgi:hypothetical protein